MRWTTHIQAILVTLRDTLQLPCYITGRGLHYAEYRKWSRDCNVRLTSCLSYSLTQRNKDKERKRKLNLTRTNIHTYLHILPCTYTHIYIYTRTLSPTLYIHTVTHTCTNAHLPADMVAGSTQETFIFYRDTIHKKMNKW